MTTTFFGEPQLKAAVRHRVAEHQRLDQIAQRFYWADGSGCFIGCSLHSNKHADAERLLGLPEWFMHLGEDIFEGLPQPDAVRMPLAIYDAVPVGVLWDRFTRDIKARFYAWLICDPEHGVVRHNADLRVRTVGEAWQRVADGEIVTDEEWGALRVAAVTAACTAATAATATAATATAATATAVTAACTAATAATDAATATLRRAQRDKLISLLRACEPEPDVTPALPEDDDFREYYSSVRLEARATSLLET